MECGLRDEDVVEASAQHDVGHETLIGRTYPTVAYVIGWTRGIAPPGRNDALIGPCQYTPVTVDEAALADLGVYRHTAEVPEGVLEAVVIDIDAADVPDGILEAIAHLPEDVAEAVVDGWYGIRRYLSSETGEEFALDCVDPLDAAPFRDLRLGESWTDYEAGPVPVTITRTR